MKNYTSIIYTIILVIIIYFFLFAHLGSRPIQTYDESRLAVNAMEMAENGNVIVTYFEGSPEQWNTKPPFVVWLQALSIKIFGVSEISVRLHSAFASAATILFLFLYFFKRHSSIQTGFIVILILLTSFGYNRLNITRVGDYNAMLTLWTTLACVSFYECIRHWHAKDRNRWLNLFFISMILGVYTKSVAILLFGPAFLIFLFAEARFIEFMTNRRVIVWIFASVSVVVGYYLLREYYQEGFIALVVQNELGGRYMETIENHQHDWTFYLFRIHELCFKIWVYVLPISLFFLLKKKTSNQSLVSYLWVCVIVYLAVISTSATKLETYDTPIYPLLSMIAGMSLIDLGNMFKFGGSPWRKKLILGVCFLMLFSIPAYDNIHTNYQSAPDLQMDEFGYFMKKNPDIDQYIVANLGYNSHLLFYQMMGQIKGDKDILLTSPELVQVPDIVLVCQEESKSIIHEKFEYIVLQEEMHCKYVQLEAIKQAIK